MAAANSFVSPVHLDGKLNVLVQSLSKWLKVRLDPPRVKVSLAANQLVGSGVVSMIVWPAPTISPWQWQVGGTFWSAGNASRLTAPETGWYHVQFCGQFDVNATGARFMGIMVNGSVWISQMMGDGNASFLWGGSVSTDLYLTAGEYVECGVYHTAGVNLNFSITYAVAASMRRIATPK